VGLGNLEAEPSQYVEETSVWPQDVAVDVNIAPHQVDHEQALAGLRRREVFDSSIEEMLGKNRPGEIAVDGIGGEVEVRREMHQIFDNPRRVVGIQRLRVLDHLVELEQLVLGFPPRYDHFDDVSWAFRDV